MVTTKNLLIDCTHPQKSAEMWKIQIRGSPSTKRPTPMAATGPCDPTELNSRSKDRWWLEWLVRCRLSTFKMLSTCMPTKRASQTTTRVTSGTCEEGEEGSVSSGYWGITGASRFQTRKIGSASFSWQSRKNARGLLKLLESKQSRKMRCSFSLVAFVLSGRK